MRARLCKGSMQLLDHLLANFFLGGRSIEGERSRGHAAEENLIAIMWTRWPAGQKLAACSMRQPCSIGILDHTLNESRHACVWYNARKHTNEARVASLYDSSVIEADPVNAVVTAAKFVSNILKFSMKYRCIHVLDLPTVLDLRICDYVSDLACVCVVINFVVVSIF